MIDTEENLRLTPKFDAQGLITAVVTDSLTGIVLMVAHMNEEALTKTIETRQAWYWSRSRSKLWRKGETSGHTQTMLEMYVDCDQDAVWMIVRQEGSACHTNRKSCFYRKIDMQAGDKTSLQFV